MSNITTKPIAMPVGASKTGYNRFLLLVAGLGGLLYGVDVGIISGALPYLEATSRLNAGQLSFIVAAVLLGSAISTLFAGLLADWMGRKWLMILSGLLFVASIPMIALASSYELLIVGRLLQGISGGLIGVVVPLYLAECLGASSRGKGTAVFQWMLTLGIVAAAVVAYYFSLKLDGMEENFRDNLKSATAAGADVAGLKTAFAHDLFVFKDSAWRSIFWVSLPPGLLFVLGSFLVAESPRWLFRRGRKEAARAALLHSRNPEQADLELQEMEATRAAEKAATGAKLNESLLHRKYVIPFLLACVILACNQATGVNSIIGYNATILIQAGLNDRSAHLGYIILTVVNFCLTIGAVVLVDRKGRKFLLSLGSAGVIISLVGTGLVFHQTEQHRVDCKAAAQAMVTTEQTLTLDFNQQTANTLLASTGAAGQAISGKPSTIIVIYSCGDYVAASRVVRSDDPAARLEITRESCLPSSKVESFFKNPFANLEAAKSAPLKIENALITPIPSTASGWLTAFCIYCFMAFFAVGPGVCVWLALSELMPTRIRSNGMSIALLLNVGISAAIAAIFLPTVGKYGYSTMFYAFAGCTVVYFVTATFFLPETKGKTLEEIEEHFEGKKRM